jgi:hypothetical protein
MMRFSFIIVFLLSLFYAESFAQNISPYRNFPIYYNDTAMWNRIETLDSIISSNRRRQLYERGTVTLLGDPKYDLNRQPGLDNLLGMSKEFAEPVISKYNYHNFTPEHPYPFIKNIIVITDYQRWKLPTQSYIFFDSSDHVCRISYKIDTGEIPFNDAKEIVRTLSARLGEEKHWTTDEYDFNTWESPENEYYMMWQRRMVNVQPVYILETKEYLSRLMYYLIDHPMPADDIFTPDPVTIRKQ